MQPEIKSLTDKVAALQIAEPVGRVSASDANQVTVTGLTHICRLGDRVEIDGPDKGSVVGEVVRIEESTIHVMPENNLTGVAFGARVTPLPPLMIAPDDHWIGRVIDPSGRALDGRPLHMGPVPRPLDNDPPPATDRRGFGERMRTGSHALNTVLPLVRGQRIGLFAGSGVGKSSLLSHLVKHVDSDVVVVALVGERGRELGHFVRSVLGPEGMVKTVVVAATSDRPALERRRCALTAMTVAEHFRDKGQSVLYVADSVTRFAEAHREFAAAIGEVPVLRGHPPSTAHQITRLCERAGPGVKGTGDITAVLSVLVQGSDMEEPIADILRGVLDGHIVLDRDIAERGRYPAINLARSVSRSLPEAATEEQNQIIGRVRQLVSLYDQNVMLIRSGLYSNGVDPELDQAVKLWPDLDAFLGQTADLSHEDCFDRLQLILRRA